MTKNTPLLLLSLSNYLFGFWKPFTCVHVFRFNSGLQQCTAPYFTRAFIVEYCRLKSCYTDVNKMPTLYVVQKWQSGRLVKFVSADVNFTRLKARAALRWKLISARRKIAQWKLPGKAFSRSRPLCSDDSLLCERSR